jgi:2-polyprenyl-3-methyl-5-hydroxy-6-metoxy-1,4-benzoquinol methylase
MLRLHLDGARALASGTARTVEATVGWIVETFRPGSGDAVLDLGCGPGLYTHRLARTGAAVTGIDFSDRSPAHARGQAEAEGLTIR